MMTEGLNSDSPPCPFFPTNDSPSLYPDTISTFPVNLFDNTTPTSSTSTLTTPSSTSLNLDTLDQPIVPSTFLPSYYPDSRDRLPLPSQRNMASLKTRSISHTAQDVDRISASGPSNRHLLDGVKFETSPPRPSRPTINTPTYDISPTAYTRNLYPNINPWVPKKRGEWNELPFEIEGGSGSTSHYGHSSSLSHTNPPFSSSSSPAPPRQGDSKLSTNASFDSFSIPNSRPYAANSNPVSNQGNGNYSDALYSSTSIPDGGMANWNTDESKVSGEDYARALKLYEQLHAAIPNIRPLSQSAPVPQGQEYENLLRLAQDGIAAVTGQQVPDPIPKPSSTAPSRSGSINAPAKRAHGGKDKAPTKCLGCGATETPEWRRGPLGPRTLCNACGLVHMKLQRKKRKLEEKAAAAAAAAGKDQ